MLRVGIVGCGGIANQKHMPSLKQFPERAETLFAQAEVKAKEKYEHLCKLADLYNN